MQNNYQIIFKAGSTIDFIDVLIDEDSDECDSHFAVGLTQFDTITLDGSKKLIHVATDTIAIIVPR